MTMYPWLLLHPLMFLWSLQTPLLTRFFTPLFSLRSSPAFLTTSHLVFQRRTKHGLLYLLCQLITHLCRPRNYPVKVPWTGFIIRRRFRDLRLLIYDERWVWCLFLLVYYCLPYIKFGNNSHIFMKFGVNVMPLEAIICFVSKNLEFW